MTLVFLVGLASQLLAGFLVPAGGDDLLVLLDELGEHDLAEDLARPMGDVPGVFLGGQVGHDQELDGLDDHVETDGPGGSGDGPADGSGDLLGRQLLVTGMVDELEERDGGRHLEQMPGRSWPGRGA